MCGICGLAPADPAQPVQPGLLERMTALVRHRGPDSDGFHLAPGIGLGVRRLAINDLATGDQPISGEDGSVTVVCNGEIYNFVELRAELETAGHRFRTGSDVEVIVHLYEERGLECLRELRGMFAFALWDARRRRLLLARDRLGIKPLQYAVGPHGCLFGSELKSILVSGLVQREPDPRSIRDLFTLGFVTAPKTMFLRICRLLPGHYLLYQDGRATLHRWWEVAFPRRQDEERGIPTATWARLLLDKLQESVRLHLRSDVPIGVWLSPGVDSSSIASLASSQLSEPLRTYSLGFEQREADELSRASTLDQYPEYRLRGRQIVCRAEDFERLSNAVWHTEEPLMTGIEIAQLRLAEVTARDVKVILTGEGSDELFGGYLSYRVDRLLRPMARLPRSLRELILRVPTVRARWPGGSRLLLAPAEPGHERFQQTIGPLGGELHARILSAELRQELAQAGDSDEGLHLPPEFESWHPFARLQYLDHTVRLPNFITHQLDRATMAHSVEARVPFLDHELVELAARIPVRLKLRGWQEKHILREALRGHLPEAIRTRPKRGLTAPRAHWLRGRLPDYASELLGHDAVAQKGYFDPDVVVALLELHRSAQADLGPQLLAVLGVHLWDELFVQGCQPG